MVSRLINMNIGSRCIESWDKQPNRRIRQRFCTEHIVQCQVKAIRFICFRVRKAAGTYARETSMTGIFRGPL